MAGPPQDESASWGAAHGMQDRGASGPSPGSLLAHNPGFIRIATMQIPAHFSTDPLTPALRVTLHDEVHARPPQDLHAPLAVTHLVMLAGAAERAASRDHLAALLAGPVIKGEAGMNVAKAMLQFAQMHAQRAAASDANQQRTTREHIPGWIKDRA